MNKLIVAVFAVVALLSFGAVSKSVEAVPVTSHPEITVDQTACDELTLTVTTYISHPEEETGTYTLVTGWLGDDLDPVSHEIETGEEVYVYTEVIGLPFDGDTFRAVLDIDGFSPQQFPFDEEDVEATDETCSSISVRKDVDPEDNTGQDFNFTLGDTSFELEDDDPAYVLDGLEAGTYRLHEIVPVGFFLESIDCGDAELTDADIDDADVNIVLGEDEDVECVVNNAPVVIPTAVPTSTPVATQTPVIVQSPPQVIFVPAPTTVPTRVPTAIRPPSTGDAGLVD